MPDESTVPEVSGEEAPHADRFERAMQRVGLAETPAPAQAAEETDDNAEEADQVAPPAPAGQAATQAPAAPPVNAPAPAMTPEMLAAVQQYMAQVLGQQPTARVEAPAPQLPQEAQEALAWRAQLEEAIRTDAFAVLEVLGIPDPAAFVQAVAAGSGNPADPGRKSRLEAKRLAEENERLRQAEEARQLAAEEAEAEAEAIRGFAGVVRVAEKDYPVMGALGERSLRQALAWAKAEATRPGGHVPTYAEALSATQKAVYDDLDTLMKIPAVRARYGLPESNGSQAPATKATKPARRAKQPESAPERETPRESRLDRALRRAGAHL